LACLKVREELNLASGKVQRQRNEAGLVFGLESDTTGCKDGNWEMENGKWKMPKQSGGVFCRAKNSANNVKLY